MKDTQRRPKERVLRGTLDGPSKTIEVEPVTLPSQTPAPTPAAPPQKEPERAPAPSRPS
jgi:hypothetical protein